MVRINKIKKIVCQYKNDQLDCSSLALLTRMSLSKPDAAISLHILIYSLHSVRKTSLVRFSSADDVEKNSP